MKDLIVLMITYNGNRFFQKQLDSICSQNNLKEIIIQDDHSEVSFYDFMQNQIAKRETEISVNRNDENLGVVRNIKKLIGLNKHACWLALSDQDDIWEPQKLEVVKEAIESKNLALSKPQLVYHDACVIDTEDNLIYTSFWELLGQDWYEHRLETFLYGNYITGGTMIFNKELAEYASDIPEDLKTLHDAWLGLCALVFGEVIKVNKKLNKYRFHDSNVAFDKAPKRSKNPFEKMQDWFTDKEFLSDELRMVERFMEVYDKGIPIEKKKILKAFLKLKGQPTWYKKLYKHLTIRKFKMTL